MRVMPLRVSTTAYRPPKGVVVLGLLELSSEDDARDFPSFSASFAFSHSCHDILPSFLLLMGADPFSLS